MTTSISADVLMGYECVGLSLFLFSRKPYIRVSQRCHFLWEFYALRFSQITLRHSTGSKISFHLFYFHLRLQSHPDLQTNSDTLCHYEYEPTIYN